MDATRRRGRKETPVTEVVDLIGHATKTKLSGKKKGRLGMKSSSKSNKTTGTTLLIVYLKLRLIKDKRSNLDLFPNPPLVTVPEELREPHEQNAKLPEPDI